MNLFWQRLKTSGSEHQSIVAFECHVFKKYNKISHLCDAQLGANPLKILIRADYLAVVSVFDSPPVKVSPAGSFYYTG